MENSQRIRVGAVSYRNALPLLYGMRDPEFSAFAEITLDYPSRLATSLLQDELDIALLPVAAIGEIPGAHIVGDYCIAADGPVASVAVFSRKPLEKLDAIYLDYQSRTSVRLAQLLLERHWKKDIALIPAPEDYISRISGNVGGVIIGDRALQQLADFPYVYDLAEAWKEMTGLPFVFAAWVANKSLPDWFIKLLNAANSKGLAQLDEIISTQDFPDYDLLEYYTHNIHYIRTAEKKSGLELFLKLIAL